MVENRMDKPWMKVTEMILIEFRDAKPRELHNIDVEEYAQPSPSDLHSSNSSNERFQGRLDFTRETLLTGKRSGWVFFNREQYPQLSSLNGSMYSFLERYLSGNYTMKSQHPN